MAKKKEWSNDIRELIISHREDEKSIREIARIVKVPMSTAYSVSMKHQTTGPVENLPRPGRKRTTPKGADRKIQRKVLRNRRLSAKSFVKQIKDDFGLTVCPKTVRNRLYEISLHGRVARKKPLLRKQNRIKRLQWATNYKPKSNSFWDRVL